jgi:hypothetical protein
MMMAISGLFEQEYFIMDTKTLLPLGFPMEVILLHKVCTTALLAEKHTEEH